jgi:urease accessory protein
MKARAQLRVAGERCDVLRSDPPLTFRETPAGLHWIGSAAGPIGGDDLALDVELEDAAALVLSSVAASMAHPGPSGEPSSFRLTARVGEGAELRWQPRPAVLVRGCDHRVSAELDLAAGARLVWREEVVLGRHDETSGSLRQRLVVDRAGWPLLRTELAVGPRWPGSLGPAGVDGARAVGSLLLVGLAIAPAVTPPDVRLAVQTLDASAVLVTALGARASAVGAALDALVPARRVAASERQTVRRMMASP